MSETALVETEHHALYRFYNEAGDLLYVGISVNMNRLHARIEKVTGACFGIHRRHSETSPEFLGAFYVRLGRTKADLVPVEVGFGSRFFWMTWGVS